MAIQEKVHKRVAVKEGEWKNERTFDYGELTFTGKSRAWRHNKNWQLEAKAIYI